jgi:hypothetical protein
MQIFLQLNNPLSTVLTSATFNITANVGLVIPATATGAQLLAGINATVNDSAIVITLTPIGTQCNNPIDIWITPATTTTTTTADPGICFTYSAPLPNLYSLTVLPTLPGYAGKPTYTIPGVGFVYWSPSQLRWEFGSLIDSGSLYSYLNNSGPKPISGSPNNWIDANIIVGDPSMSTSIFGVCPPPTTTTTSSSSTSTTSTTSSTSTTTSTSSTTTTTTAAPICCAPLISSISQNPSTGTITVSYTYNPSPLTCISCNYITLQYSIDNGTTWISANTSGCSNQITTTNKPAGSKFRLIMGCIGNTISVPSNIVTLAGSATTSTTVAPIPCYYGVIGGTGCCQAVISSVSCISVPNGTGLNNGTWSLAMNVSANTPSNCACGTAYFVEYRVNGTGSWIAMGSPINSDIQGRLIINSIYGSLVPATTSYIDIRIRTTCNGSSWSTEYTYTPCRKWFNGTNSPISMPTGGIFVNPGQSYCYSGFLNNGLTVTGWCWQGSNIGVGGSCSNC